MNSDIFENIRPFNDSEVEAAIARIVSDPLINEVSSYLFPKGGGEQFVEVLSSCKTIEDFQLKIMYGVVRRILADTASNLSFSGVENFKEGNRYLLISNHRDIVLDSAIIQIILADHKIPTTEIAVGDNLMVSNFIEDITRINKMIKVIRSTSPREVYTTSKVLSEYIRCSVSQANSTIWLAQRNGRTKDGVDVTEQGLLKMLGMSGGKDFVKSFTELNILPVSISYEYEPCDYLKAMEIYVSRRQKYVKSKNEDLNSILTGMMQFKGDIHISFANSLQSSDIEPTSNLDNNDKFQYLASVIDNKINSGYKLFKSNYIAYDMLNSTSEYVSMYTPEEKQKFASYVELKLELAEVDKVELEEIFLSIYANPVKISREL